MQGLLCALAVLPAVLVTACAGEEETLLAESQLPGLVLQPADLTGPWTRFDEGRQIRADAPAGVRADPARFGRQEGWKARYRRPGSAETEGPLVVESRADLFDDVSGAQDDFDAAAGELGDRAEDIDLGDEARASVAAGSVTTVTIVWRERNLVSTVTANGFAGKLELADVVDLARRQQERAENG